MTQSRMRVLCLLLLLVPSMAEAQNEDRTVGRQGATQIGFSFSTISVSQGDSDIESPTVYYGNVEVGRFLTDRFVLRGGLSGIGTFGGDDDSGEDFGFTQFSGLVGLLLYFSPSSVGSAYVGADYSFTLTNRVDGDNGTIYGRVGVQGAVTPRAAIFGEFGYGRQMYSAPEFGEAPDVSYIVTQFGLRLVF